MKLFSKLLAVTTILVFTSMSFAEENGWICVSIDGLGDEYDVYINSFPIQVDEDPIQINEDPIPIEDNHIFQFAPGKWTVKVAIYSSGSSNPIWGDDKQVEVISIDTTNVLFSEIKY